MQKVFLSCIERRPQLFNNDPTMLAKVCLSEYARNRKYFEKGEEDATSKLRLNELPEDE